MAYSRPVRTKTRPPGRRARVDSRIELGHLLPDGRWWALRFVLATWIACGTSLAGPLQSDPAKRNCEWIAIVPQSQVAPVEPLRDFRLSQGHSACIWTLEDVVASYGGARPENIRAALHDAWNTWATRPRWVCLFADHCVGSYEYVPSAGVIPDCKIPNAELGRWEPYIRGLLPLMDADDDSLPDIAVGRVPFDHLYGYEDISRYVQKVVSHDLALAGGGAYRGSVMLVEDENVAGNDSIWVRHLADSLYEHWDHSPSRLILHHSSLPCCQSSPREAAIAGWNTAPGVVIAMGNGSNWFELVGFWETCAEVGWFTPYDLAPNAFPALLALSCAVNGTDRPMASSCDQLGYQPIVRELLLAYADRGASLVIAPTRNTIQYWDFFVGKHLLERRAAGDATWGDVHVHAMREALLEDRASYDHVFQYAIEGDPAALANPTPAAGVSARLRSMNLELHAPFPSPAREAVRFEYDVAKSGFVELVICDVAGRRVRLLANERLEGGRHAHTWDLRDAHGEAVSPGTYFVRLSDGEATRRARVIVVR